MKTKLLVSLVLILAGGLMGCVTAHRPPATPAEIDNAPPDEFQRPIKFTGYHALYTYIAQHEGLATDSNTVFKLAADSQTEVLAVNKSLPWVYAVESHYYDGGAYDQIRGAQGNGNYYILRPLATNDVNLDTDKGFELVGILEGNYYELHYSNNVPQFIAYWHMSASESDPSIYEWNGTIFKHVK